VSGAALSSWEDSGETGHSSLSEADSLDDSRANKAEERSPRDKKDKTLENTGKKNLRYHEKNPGG